MTNVGHFRIRHPQISLKQFSDICENEVYFFYYVGEWKNEDFCKTENFKKKMKMVSFFYILQLPHTVISNSEQLTHPNVECTIVHKQQ